MAGRDRGLQRPLRDGAVTALSKAMVKLLRHDVRKRGLSLDAQGFMLLSTALEAVDANWEGLATLEERWRDVMAAQEHGPNPKQRFVEQRREGVVWVRALPRVSGLGSGMP